MQYRNLNRDDVKIYLNDIISCYNSNRFILDSQSSLNFLNPENLYEFILGFVEAEDSIVVGLFDDNFQFLYGLVIFDSIRFGQGIKATAEVHIAVDRTAFGKITFHLLEELQRDCGFTTLFCHVPSIANRAIALLKKLNFKKTGYIPNCLPYKNLKGEEDLYDVQIWVYNRPNIIDELLEDEEIPF